MIGIEESIIRVLSHHKISSEGKKSFISDSPFEYSNEDEENVLKKLLLKPFLSNSHTFEFFHAVSLDYNILYNLSQKMFSEEEDFFNLSKKIAQHLISVSKHPNIKEGDLFVAKFENLKLGNKFIEGIGIYKFEEKESFIETSISNNAIDRRFLKGIGSKKPDKACLILFTESPYTILIIDNNTKETDYWQNEFIQHKPKNDNVNSTHNFLNITKNFITSQMQNDFEVSKADQIDFLNRSVDYFKKNEMFDKIEFEETVFGDNNVIDSFRKFDEIYRQENEVDLADNFEISAQAVKKQARIFKNVLKLDKNFHIYIHGNRELIEQGIDEKGRKFYKIYYEEEN